MLVYLLKSSTCLLVFSLFYKLVLERENIHTFKRFYLLGSLAIAFYIPLITFTTYIEQPVVDFQASNSILLGTNDVIPIEETTNWNLVILWTTYGLGTSFFAFKFLLNLYKLTRKIRLNEKVIHEDYVHVLLLNRIVPHTFLKYIFLEKRAFDEHKIPREILLHEHTHAKQKHSLDILFVEFLQIVFWFNPLIYIFKKDIKLNHEFLADHEVINHGYNTKNYQNILLNYSSKTTEHSLESSINYPSIKKRFTLMKTHTSKTAIWLRSLIAIPLLAFLIYGFSERKEVVKPANLDSFAFTVVKSNNHIILETNSKSCRWARLTLDPNQQTYTINDFGFSEGNNIKKDKFAFTIKADDSHVTLKGLKGTAWTDLSFSLKETQKQAVNEFGMTSLSQSAQEENIISAAKPLEIKAINNTIKINSTTSSLGTYKKDLNAITKSWTQENYFSTIPKLEIENCSEDFLKILDTEFRKTDYYLITIQGSENILQQGASKEQIAEYNKLARKYNSLSEDNLVFKKEDVERMEYLYGLMNKEQKANAEPFPNIPPPPPPPPAPPIDRNNMSPELLELENLYNKKTKEYGTAVSNYVKNKKGNQADLKSQYDEMMKLYEKYYDKATQEKASIAPPPPPPPKPIKDIPSKEKD